MIIILMFDEFVPCRGWQDSIEVDRRLTVKEVGLLRCGVFRAKEILVKETKRRHLPV